MASHILDAFNRFSKKFAREADRTPDKSVTNDNASPQRSAFIQTEALPPYIDELYHCIARNADRNGSGHPAHDGHDYLRTIDSLPPHQAKDTLLSAGPLLDNPNLANLPERERKTFEIILAQKLSFQDMSDEVSAFLTNYINQCQPDEAFISDEDDKITTVVRNILADPGNIDLIYAMRAKKFHTRDNMAQQYYLRLHFMQAVANEISYEHRLRAVPVILDEFPAVLSQSSAYAIRENYIAGVPDTGMVLINAKSTVINIVELMINLVGHEMRHIIDQKLANAIKSGALPESDINFIHASLIALNEPSYASPPLAREKKVDQTKFGEQFNRYSAQYMERAARNFGERLEKNLAPHLPTIADPSFEIEKIHEFSMH